MNTFFRITVAIYALISTFISVVIMISPFGEKSLMNLILQKADANFYRGNSYDVLIFIIGLVSLLISIAILSSGIRGKRSSKYISRTNESGTINISANSIENIALVMSKRFQGVKDAKAKAIFSKGELIISIKLQAYTEVSLPDLCKGVQERVRDSVESSTEIKVKSVTVNVENVSQQGG